VQSKVGVGRRSPALWGRPHTAGVVGVVVVLVQGGVLLRGLHSALGARSGPCRGRAVVFGVVIGQVVKSPEGGGGGGRDGHSRASFLFFFPLFAIFILLLFFFSFLLGELQRGAAAHRDSTGGGG